MFLVFYKEVHGILPESITTAYNGAAFPDIERDLSPVLEFPGHLVGSGIIFQVPDLPSSFQDECLQAFCCKFFGCPAATHAGADHDGVEAVLFYWIAHNSLLLRCRFCFINRNTTMVPSGYQLIYMD